MSEILQDQKEKIMQETDQEALKQTVHDFWNEKSCGTEFAESGKFTKEYFDEIEATRYLMEPEIFSFAQFTSHHGKKILKVGVGAGTDFLQWVRAGCRAYGVDLTQEAITMLNTGLLFTVLKSAKYVPPTASLSRMRIILSTWFTVGE